MPAKQHAGRIATAELIADQPIHFAWGAGDPAWDVNPQPEPVDAPGLVAEIGRRTATQVGFAVPDDAGSIETPNGNFSPSPVPTRWLHVRCTFAFDDAPAAHIREIAVFIGTKTDPGLPSGQRYFTPDQLTNPGHCYLLDRSQNFGRSGTVRAGFEYILPF